MNADGRDPTGTQRSDELVVRVPDELPTLTPEAARILLKIVVELYEQRVSERDAQAGEDLHIVSTDESSFVADGGETTGGG